MASEPIFDALDNAPEGEDDMTPEQRAEYAAIVAEYEAGRARLIPNDEVPAALEEIALARGHAA